MGVEELQQLQEELKHWQNEVKNAEHEKDQLVLQKLDADHLKNLAQDKLAKLMEEGKEINATMTNREAEFEEKRSRFIENSSELKKDITILQQNVRAVRAKCKEIAARTKFQNGLPEKKVKFTHVDTTENGILDLEKTKNICGQFYVTTKIPFELEGGQALITFEEEKVAQNIIKKQRHNVNLDTETVEAKSTPVPLEVGLKFEIHVAISRKDVCVKHLPGYVPEECLRDKLELHFYKSKVGGGEIDDVQFNTEAKMSTITFTDPGVAQHVVKRRKHTIRNSRDTYEVTVCPHIESHLEKLQIFSGIAKRTVLLTGVRNVGEEEETIQDLIEIFFQKPSNGGGEILSIKYVSDDSVTAYFEEEDLKAE
ncbi:hypothetical protein NDU88_005284 [Pleurodeles waltl]|uniref:NID domain-containing protein n=1 Tax=Pleurodeles waltl TaxID=8319 RepID=A0AAV7UHQ4_PLEWA|nr:hypothetical protein NDU88_005284 [Pleurodeles waltl]